MLRVILLAAASLVLPVHGACQTSGSESKTLQELLAEVRLLRQDLHATTVAVQRAQILVHRVYAQENLVRSERERADRARSALAQIQLDQKNREARIKEIEDRLASNNGPQAEQMALEDALGEAKQSYQLHANDESDAQAKLTEAEEQLHSEEAKLSELEERLDQLDKDLAESTNRNRN